MYYPELSKATDLSDWGPVGTPDDIIAWIQDFAARGVSHFICRFGDLDQFDQVERFSREVLPAFADSNITVTAD
jgi:alkanesulfonate monooxygenase SsuD/methylene tetrahydromethanopterin reductase-like flavin-dependent oxidoreductase (luciferase family)